MASHKIVVDDVSKRFRLQRDPPSSVKEIFTRRDRDKEVDYFWALRNVSLEIPEGSMYALIGHNGCGKSTLLRCIAGIYQPNGGAVHVDGRISTLLELGAGFHPDLSGRENIYMNATMLGMSRKNIDKVFDDIVDFAGVRTFVDSPVKVYSTGMYVRLGFSVAVHVRPEILIIDEVIAVGDEEFQRRCFDHLYGLRKEGVTIVVVTHGLGIVEQMCDGAAWLDHGELQIVGPASEVTAAYLKKVNTKEIEEGTSRMGAARSDRTTEAGDGDEDIRLTRVELLNDEGTVVSAAIHGTPLTIRIHFNAAREVDAPVIGIALFSASNVHLSGTNTQIDGVTTGAVLGDSYIDFRIPRLPLTPGEYELSVAITDKHVQHFFVRAERQWRIPVRLGEGLAPHGLMDLSGEWGGPARA